MKNLETPIMLINFKSYKEGTGKKALKLAKTVEKVKKITGVNICVSPQYTDLFMISRSVNIPIFAQHIDPISFGASTGHVLPEAIKQVGAVGTIINHSEKQLLLKDIESAVNIAKSLDLISVVCCDTPKTSASVSYFKPNFVSIEPPDLIGTGISVSKARPEAVLETVNIVKNVDSSTIILCGAGITSGADVEAALKLGASGILVASGILKAKNPETVILDLAKAMKEN